MARARNPIGGVVSDWAPPATPVFDYEGMNPAGIERRAFGHSLVHIPDDFRLAYENRALSKYRAVDKLYFQLNGHSRLISSGAAAHRILLARIGVSMLPVPFQLTTETS